MPGRPIAASRLLRVLAASAALLATPAGPTTAQAFRTPPDFTKGGPPLATAPRIPAAFVEANNTFAFDLYGRLRRREGNLFLSPYSVTTALAMTYAGARGETAGQMANVLHLDLPPESLHPAFRALIGHINGDPAAPETERPFQLVTANALWGQKGDGFLETFLRLTREDYGAGLREVDFRADPDLARREINAWVEGQTRQKIQELLAPSAVGADTSLILTNAVYFKSAWLHPFQEGATRKDGTFTAPGGRKVSAPLMGQTQRFDHHDGGTFQLLDLPYAGGALSMTILLPRGADGLGALEDRLDAKKLAEWVGLAKPARVAVLLPKFKTTEQFALADTLRSMGMTLPFQAGKADFSGINGKRDLLISEVIHKAFVDVNEQGTEAAAATAVAMYATSAFVPSPPIEFRADHPFLFLIRDRVTGTVLFMGRLNDPRG